MLGGVSGSLTASLVAASPMLGLDAWTAASRLFARQLEAGGFYHQAVTHLLACHQVFEAISVYRKARKRLHGCFLLLALHASSP